MEFSKPFYVRRLIAKGQDLVMAPCTKSGYPLEGKCNLDSFYFCYPVWSRCMGLELEMNEIKRVEVLTREVKENMIPATEGS